MEPPQLAELERVQTGILNRISNPDLFLLPKQRPLHRRRHRHHRHHGATEARLSTILRSKGVTDFVFVKAPSDYYDRSIESRRDILGAASIHHRCKSTVLYTARFNADAVKNYLFALNDGKIAKKKINLKLALEETSAKLMGYEHNAVTCVGLKTDMPCKSLPKVFLMCTCTCFPDSTRFSVLSCLMQHEHFVSLSQGLTAEVILDDAIVSLNPDFFWVGGGEVSLKLGIRTLEFIYFVKPSIASCSGT